MEEIIKTLNGLVEDEEGQGLVEYALILALVAVVVIATLTLIGGNIKEKFQQIQQDIKTPPTTP